MAKVEFVSIMKEETKEELSITNGRLAKKKSAEGEEEDFLERQHDRCYCL